MKKPENDACETHSRAFLAFVNGGAAQRAGNRAMTGTVYNRCYVNSLWYTKNHMIHAISLSSE